ncbi:zinc ABC transporter substrate-binding protein AdcA [Streptococcus panodentis]|uniref:Zinc ABC transporter substrate-binding protein AdcA n=1 Tax=Streptococcus panodentis TaxID=1581472 RepID=A0ABS5B083_9STRE|nr:MULTISPECIES: zinc ABC transporter substrate-binding protein AdcA [Streptococcus]KXT83117.1 putative zinc-binding lipoprotein ZinT [Streptococcus sp. DD11]MBP2622253.1 zinc ABC transporter substrate-binding protein AdcA [Streptococcus panodentis]
MKKIALLLAGLLSLFLAACSNQNNADGKLNIVTTFYPVYEFTKQVAGDTANVELLIGAGTEPHDYEPSAKAVAAIQDADAFVYENENMETWVPDLLKSLTNKKETVIKATGDMLLLPGGEEEEEHDHGEEGHHHEYDPHVWLSPKRAIKMVEHIRDSLSKAYPDQKAAFDKNAAAYIKKLQVLDKEYEEGLGKAKQKSFVTQHAAFNYLALDYGLKQVPISGLSPDSEPSASRLAELTEYIKKNKIKYIYFEENASQALASTLAKETGVTLDVLNPLESLTEEQTKDGADYISIMQANLKALQQTTDQEGAEIAAEKEEDSQTVQNGYFEDSAVKDRELSDYAGEWQSVYPYLQDGTLDQVFDYKAKLKGDKTAAEYKDYYNKGYKTDVSHINITDKTMEFVVDGQSKKYTYKYVGKHTLTYSKGNRGVRFMFEATDADAGQYKYVQFSDHNIAPTKAEHFHIFYGGESQEALFDELENWPTYYPSDLSGQEIAQEMLAH